MQIIMNNSRYLSVVIPCFNEKQNLNSGCLDKVISYFKNSNLSHEILVIDDASTDNSAKILEKYASDGKIRFIKKEHSFKAGTVIRGIKETSGKYVLMIDMDQATPISEFSKFTPFMEKNIEIIIGSRKDERKGAPLSRKIMAKGFILLRNLILGLHGIKDTQCGFKVFRKEVILNIINKLKLYRDGQRSDQSSKVTAGFDVEILFVAKKMKCKIEEIPVEWNYVETRRVSPLTDSIDGLIDMLKIRLNDYLHKYD